MPVPQLNEHGLLPEGIHDCSIEEIREAFGGTFSSPLRRRLCDNLKRFLDDVRSTRMAVAVIVNGSFVTDKEEPGDIDLILVVRRDTDLSGILRPFQLM